MADDVKPTNPKDVIGSTKLPLGVVPAAGSYYAAEAFLEGALKYGRYNWRIAGVRASIYYDALRSHGEKWWNGQNRDPKTLVHELGALRACVDIMIDAIECEKLTDDRPPSMPEGALERLRNSPTVTHLLAMYPQDREGAPKQYTITDTAATQAEESTRESPGQSPPRCTYFDNGVCRPSALSFTLCCGCDRDLRVG